MTKKALKILLFYILCMFTQSAYAVDNYDIITRDFDGLKEEIHENVTNTDDEHNYLKNEENQHSVSEEIEDNTEVEFKLFEDIDKEKKEDKTIKQQASTEDSLFAKIVKNDIVRTDIPQYLLKDELTFYYDKGPVSKVQFYGAYQGSTNFRWSESHYDSTNYEYGFMQVGMMGKLKDDHTDFKLLFNPRPVDGLNYSQSFISDAYIVNNRIPHHRIVVGNSRNTVGFEGSSSSYILPFVARSQISRTFGNSRALGVKVLGNYSLVDYSLAVNSSDRYFHEFFPGAEFTGWVNFKPLGKTNGKYGRLTIGGGVNAGKNGSDYTVGGVYVGYKYKKLWTTFEYAIADGYNGKAISTKKAEGFYGTIGYKITPHVQLIARYDQFDPDRNKSGNLKREISAGINWFIKGQALRIILNYVYCMNQNSPDSSRIILATQFLL